MKLSLLLRRFTCILTDSRYAFAIVLFFAWIGSGSPLHGQLSIDWQKSLGTPNFDQAFLLFADDDGNIVIAGQEPHADFAGTIRPYLMVMKVDPTGEEIWKTYHDIAFNTFNAPLNYQLTHHFYTEEWGDTLINLLIRFPGRDLLYKIRDRTGTYFIWEEVASSMLDVARSGEKVYANVLCSVQDACYGPDSLVVEKFDPTPDSIVFDPIAWRYAVKQNIRTSPIQGHYDFQVQDIREDISGHTYLLVQIQRWDFQFCTDCPDRFVDAWCEVFQLDEMGQLLRHVRLKTATAVVSRMQFIELRDDKLLVQVQDINVAGTKMISTVYHLDKELHILLSFNLDMAYANIVADDTMGLYGLTSVNDPNDPEIKGLTDVLVARFDAQGLLLWRGYFGGSSFDFPKGMVVDSDGAVFFLAQTESDDFDVEGHNGGQDIWLVKLSEATVAVVPEGSEFAIKLFPNPSSDGFYVEAQMGLVGIRVFDGKGCIVHNHSLLTAYTYMDAGKWPAGTYLVQLTDASGSMYTRTWIKAQ